MEFIKEQTINKIKTINFKDNLEKESYKNTIGGIINIICKFIYDKNLDYDYKSLEERVENLTIENRDGICPEYVFETNTLYISKINQKGEKLSEAEQLVFIIHELFHFLSTKEHPDSLTRDFYAFEEFFTEYLTFLIILRIGPNFEKFYRKNMIGYFNEDDNKIIRNISKKVDFHELLAAYFSNSDTILKNTVPEEVLLNMQDYFDYYEAIYDKYNLPRKYLEEILNRNLSHESERSKLQEKLQKINNCIENINLTAYHY